MIHTPLPPTRNVRQILKRVPGLRATYQTIRAVKRRVQRIVAGPPLGELYDAQTEEVMARVIRPDSSCVDIGAHAGTILRHIVELAPNGHHHAVEALPDYAERLVANFPSVHVHSCAVGDITGSVDFVRAVDAPAYSGLQQRDYPYEMKTSRIRIQVERLDDLIPEDERIDLVKIDIEGGEYHAMLGAEKLLKRWHPIVIFEFGRGAADHYGVDPHMMYGLLSRCGLRVSTMKRWLAGLPELAEGEFDDRFRTAKDFYFMAYS